MKACRRRGSQQSGWSPRPSRRECNTFGAKASISGAQQNGKLNKAWRNCRPSLQDPRESQQSPCPQTHLSLRVDPLEAQICRRFRHTSTPTPSGDSARAPRALFPLQAIYLKHISNSIGFASGRFGNRIDFNRKRRPDFVDSCFWTRISGGTASTTCHGGPCRGRPSKQDF